MPKSSQVEASVPKKAPTSSLPRTWTPWGSTAGEFHSMSSAKAAITVAMSPRPKAS